MNIVKTETESAIYVRGVLQLAIVNDKPAVHQNCVIRVMSDCVCWLSKELNEKLKFMEQKINELCLQSGPQWVSVSDIALDKGLDKSSVHKQLQSGDFEEGVDFKRVGNRIVVHQGAIKRIRRKRRS